MLEVNAPSDHPRHPIVGRVAPAVGSRRVKPSKCHMAKLRVAVFNRDQWTCQDCGRHIPASAPNELSGRYAPTKTDDGAWNWLEIDHITPYMAGGEATEENCRALCSTCNRRKSASTRYADWPARIARAQALLAARQPSESTARAVAAALLGEDSSPMDCLRRSPSPIRPTWRVPMRR